MNITFTGILSDSFTTAAKNIGSLLAAGLLWLVTVWIPYINVGTTIALFYGLPLELSKGRIMNPLSIFDVKYRKYMGEFFSLVGMMSVSLIPAFLFMIVPGIIISIGWMFAIILMLDKELNPSESMMASTKYTYGYKWLIFISQICISILLLIGIFILNLIDGLINVGFVSFLILVVIIMMCVTINVAFTGVMYKQLVVNRNEPLPEVTD